MKTAAQASAKYATNAGAATSADLWATNLNSQLAAAFDAAIAAAPRWQAAVQDPAAALALKNGLTKAKGRIPAIQTKISGPSKSTFSAQVRVAGAPGGNYSNFATEFLGWQSTEQANLNRTNPRGDFTTNLARLDKYLNDLHAQKGNFKQ